MAARKNTAVKTGTMPEAWRKRIQTSMIINRLHDHIKGTHKMDPAQVTAALGLLKKSVPDMSSIDVSGELKGDFTIRWES